MIITIKDEHHHQGFLSPIPPILIYKKQWIFSLLEPLWAFWEQTRGVFQRSAALFLYERRPSLPASRVMPLLWPDVLSPSTLTFHLQKPKIKRKHMTCQILQTPANHNGDLFYLFEGCYVWKKDSCISARAEHESIFLEGRLTRAMFAIFRSWERSAHAATCQSPFHFVYNPWCIWTWSFYIYIE